MAPIVAAAATLVAVSRLPPAALAARPAPEDLAFVTDDADGLGADGCEEISVVNIRTGGTVGRSLWRKSPGRMASTSDAGLVLSVVNNNAHNTVRILLRTSGGTAWSSRDVGYSVPDGGPLAISPDDKTLLIARGRPEIAKHRIDDISLTSLGPPTGIFSGVQAAEIVFSPDSRTAYVVDTGGRVFDLDVETMQQVGPAMAYTPVRIKQSWRLRQTFASVSPDGRYLVINTGGSDINVLDLVNHRTYLVDTPGIATTHDVKFNYAQTQDSLLAIRFGVRSGLQWPTMTNAGPWRMSFQNVMARATPPPPAAGSAAEHSQ
jgi:hypothetical protein